MSYTRSKLPSSLLFSVTYQVGPALIKDKPPHPHPLYTGSYTLSFSRPLHHEYFFTGSFHPYANMLLFPLFKKQNNKHAPDPHIICQLSPFYFTSKHAYFSCLHCLTSHSLLYYDLLSVPTTLLRRLLSRSPVMTLLSNPVGIFHLYSI